jgi:hypothetical protein
MSVRLRTAFSLAALASALVGVSAEAWSQDVPPAGSWRVKQALGPADRAEYARQGFSGAAIDRVDAQCRRIVDVFAAAGPLAPPRGLDVEARASADVRRFGGGAVRTALSLSLFPLTRECDECPMEASEEGVDVLITANRLDAFYDRPDAPIRWDEELRPMYSAPNVVDQINGFPELENGVIIVKPSERPLWFPVTVERYLENEIRMATAESHRCERHLDDWEEELEETRVSVARMLAEGEITRAEAAEMRAALDESDWEHEPQKQAAEACTLWLETLELRFNGLSPEERDSPAYVLSGRSRGPLFGLPSWETGLVESGEAGARMVVTPNMDFLDPDLPWTTFQVLAIRFPPEYRSDPGADDPRGQVVHRLLVDLRSELDWGYLKKLLR